MCFTPAVSLTTAVIEFILAAIMPWKYRRARMRWFFSIFLILLGLYQLTEFFLCKTGNAALWVTTGFIVYTFLPALGLHSAFYFLKIKINWILLYIIPITATIVALATPNFVLEGRCQTIFIIARTIFEKYSNNIYLIMTIIYKAYYAGFILIICYLFTKQYLREKKSQKRKLYLIVPLAILLMTAPTFILLDIFPSLEIMFPSVLCHFALLLALTAFIGVRIEDKMRK